MENIVEGIEGVKFKVNGILVRGCSNKEHKWLQEVLNHVSSAGLKLNPDKAEIGKDEVSYVGHLLTPRGITPSPEHIINML